MSEAELFDVLKAGLWSALLLAMPILTITLIVGLIVGLFQALTSIQEMTLTFVPKLGAVFLVFWATMGFMGQTLVSFFHQEVIPAIAFP